MEWTGRSRATKAPRTDSAITITISWKQMLDRRVRVFVVNRNGAQWITAAPAADNVVAKSRMNERQRGIVASAVEEDEETRI